MDYTEQLESLKADLLLQTGKTHERLANIDWSSEFNNMTNDAEYSPLQYQQGALFVHTIQLFKNGDVFQAANNRLCTLKSMNDERAVPLETLISCIRKLIRDLKITEMNALRKVWDSVEDECEKPYLKCADCEFFGYCEQAKEDHECACDDEDRTTKCRFCGFKATTYDRLDNHIKSKHLKNCKYNCKECEYKTDSNNEFVRHNNSKGHKEKCGVKKEVKLYECKICDKEYYFESEYNRHLVSTKHKKLCCK